MGKYSTEGYGGNSGGGQLPPGKHICVIGDTFDRGETPSRTRFIRVRFDATNGDGYIYGTYWDTQKAIPILFSLIEAAGSELPREVDTDDDGQLRTLLGGKTVEVVVKPQRNNPKYSEVKFVNAVNSGGAGRSLKDAAAATHPDSTQDDDIPF